VRYLIINADDFGLTPAVSRGILDGHAAGVITSTSVMVTTPGWEDARARLQDSSIDIGLHLNLGLGRPLTPARTLVDPNTGQFAGVSGLSFGALIRRTDPADVAAECRAQLELLRSAGRPVTHLDSHWHLHALPGIWAAVLGVAREQGIQWLRSPRVPRRQQLIRAFYPFTLLGVASLWRRSSRPRFADHFTGYAMNGAREFERGVLERLDQLEPGVTEFMVHAGYDEPSLAALDTYTWEREKELAALTSPAVRARLAKEDITLTNFGALGTAGAGIFPA
jgi:chitin disaccharide deacetylase